MSEMRRIEKQREREKEEVGMGMEFCPEAGMRQ